MELSLKEILNNFPLRISLTDYCNLDCFFCSNEGMPLDQKDTNHIDLDATAYLLGLLKKEGLKHVSLTGGDPTVYPQLKYMIETINELEFEKTFFHTNGICLDQNLLDYGIDNFSKIAVSIHTIYKDTWKSITRGTDYQFQRVMSNLENLGEQGYKRRVEIKHVPINGINSSNKELKGTLELCSGYQFKFKFLNFEAVTPEHIDQVIPYSTFTKQLEELGCEEITEDRPFRGQTDYLPAKWYTYGDTKGVAIEIGCGEKQVCKACYKSNEIYISPKLEIKPCHVSNFNIGLHDLIQDRRDDDILSAVYDSRVFLFKEPGQDARYWEDKL